jgi:PKD repeat protein
VACVNQTVNFTNTSQSANQVVLQAGSYNCSSTTKINWLISPATGWTISSGSLGNNPPSNNNTSTWGSNNLGVTFTQTGNYVVSLISAGINCGGDTASQTICVINAVTPSFTLSNTVGCAPFNVNTTNNTPSISCGNNTYNWVVTYNSTNACDNTSAFSFTGGTTASSPNPSFVFNNAGSYTITLNLTNPCGSSSSSQTITVNKPPQVTINSIADICGTGSINPTSNIIDCGSSITSYLWTFPGGNPSSSNLQVPPAIAYAATNSYNVNLAITNSCGTTNAVENFNIVLPPQISVIPSTSTICAGNTVLLVANGATNYSWVPGGVNGSIGDSIFVNPSVTTTYIITGNSATCNDTAHVIVNVNPNPTINIIPTAPTICVGDSIALNATGAINYNWSPNTNLNINTGATVIANPLINTTYNVIGTDANGCSGNTNVSVAVIAYPIVDAGPDQTFCNTNSTINIVPINPLGGTWSGNGILPNGDFNPSVAGNGSWSLIYSYTNANGCSNSDTIIATVSSATSINAGNGFTICASATIFPLNSATPTGGNWSGAGIIGTNFDPSTANIGLNILTYTVGTGTCAITDTIHVIVLPNPTINFLPSNPVICFGDTVIINLNGAASYSWLPSTNLNVISTSSYEVFPNTTTNYLVSGTSVDGCVSTTNINVVVNLPSAVDAGLDLQFCDINDTIILVPNFPLNGTWTGSGLVNANGFNPSLVGSGQWSLVYTASDLNGCVNSDTIVASVTSLVNANAGNNITICANANPLNLSGLPSGGSWSGNGINAGFFDPSLVSIGNYTAVYSLGSGFCLSTDTMLIQVVQTPTITINSNLPNICLGDSINLTATGALNYLWSPALSLSNSSGNSIMAGPVSSGYYYVLATDINGCQTSDSIFININPLPTVDAGLDQQFCNQNIPVTLGGFSPLNGIWSGAGISTSGVFTPSLVGVGNWNLIYTFTDVNGCNNSDTLVASVINPAQANAGIDTNICISNNVINLIGSPSGGSWTGPNVNTNGVFTSTPNGTYTLTYTIGSGTCLTQDNINVTVNALPIVNIGPDIDYCVNGMVTNLLSNVAGGVWTGNGITNSILGTFNPILITPGQSTEIIYNFTSATTGCSNADTLIANIQPIPHALFDSLPLACINNPLVFISNTPGNNTYTWLFGDGTSSNAQQVVHTYSYPDTFNVQLIATSQFGCMDTVRHQIIVSQPPIAQFTQNQISPCGPQIITFTNTSNAPFSTFFWNFGNGIIDNTAQPLPITFNTINSPDTSFIVTLTTNNLCGTNSFQDTINLISSPIPSFNYYPQPACSGLPISFSNASFGIFNSYTWFVDGVQVSTNTILPPYTFVTDSVDAIHNVTLQTINVCDTVSITLPITVHPAIVYPFFTVDSTFTCLGETVNFISSVPSYQHIIWNYGDGANAIDTVPYHNYSNPGTYTVWQIVYGYCGIDSISRIVNILPNPNALFSTSNIICANDTALFQNLTVGNNLYYHWNFGDGNTSSLFSPNHFYQIPGNISTTYNVTLTATSASSTCKDSITQSITILPKPFANFSLVDNEVCLGKYISGTAQQSAGLTYQWELSNGTIINGNQFNYLFTDTGNYSLSLHVSDNNQCSDDTVYSLIFVRPNAEANFSYTFQPPCADNVLLVYTNTSNLANSYSWNFGVYGSSNNAIPIPLGFTSPSTFSTQLIANNQYNCPDTITKPINVVIKPKALFSAPDSACIGESFTIQNNSLYSNLFDWYIDGVNVEDTNPFNFTANKTGSIEILLKLTSADDSTCVDSITKNIVVNKLPTATFLVNQLDSIIDGKQISLCGEYFAFEPFYEYSNNYYYWELGDGRTSSLQRPKVFYENNGSYNVSLLVKNIYGCENRSDTIVNVLCIGNIVLPNALAPSNPDKTLAWFIPKGKNIETLNIEIFSTWGERVWHTNNLDREGSPTEYWDGTYNGKDLPQGAYLVKMRATFEFKSPIDKTFYVTLIR